MLQHPDEASLLSQYSLFSSWTDAPGTLVDVDPSEALCVFCF